MIIGQWSRNALLRYLMITDNNLSKFISDLIVYIRAFYKIPEAEVIYYTPGKPVFQPIG